MNNDLKNIEKQGRRMGRMYAGLFKELIASGVSRKEALEIVKDLLKNIILKSI